MAPRILAIALVVFASPSFVNASQPAKAWWPDEVEQALKRADKGRTELEKALNDVPTAQRNGMAFLIANMPERDLRLLRADFLLENVALAYKVRSEVNWGKSIPEDIFLNDVLAYANLDETREPWRKLLMELCLPLVKECQTPTEAAQKLNSTIFQSLKVKYSTQRKKANQSPKESIDSGLASCSGLSVLLSDACRSVCVPARLAGTPNWYNNRGNHTWVEVWDGRWFFTGAAEFDANGLDRGWFVGDASKATKDDPEHAIYASSFRKTNVHFPLVWDRKSREVSAENVTDRYTSTKAVASDRVRVQIRVHEVGTKKRVTVPVIVDQCEKGCEVCRGMSKGETADLNDILHFELLPERDYIVRVGSIQKPFRTPKTKELLVDVEVPAPPTKKQTLQIEKAAKDYFSADADKRAGWKFDEKLDRLLAANEDAVRDVVWKAYREAGLNAQAKKDFEANEVRYEKHVSPYVVKKVGKMPVGGWPLVIAMHGGGGVAKKFNDSQWDHMKIYYKDHPGEAGYLYLALRAPNDTWNGFYDQYVPPLVIKLIRQFTQFGEVDPDKVFIMGYSHGGYGAFYIGPKIPDRFAAIHASASAPTDGTISAKSLRNTRFTFMIGEKDTAYGRADRCKKFNEIIEKLQKNNPGEFPVKMEWIPNNGHTGLPDRDKLKELLVHRREVSPKHLTWDLTDGVIKHFFWISVAKPAAGQTIDAKLTDNKLAITTTKMEEFTLDLDARLVRYNQPLTITHNGKTTEATLRPSLRVLCESLLERGDPRLARACRVEVK
jgi:predicted esterase